MNDGEDPYFPGTICCATADSSVNEEFIAVSAEYSRNFVDASEQMERELHKHNVHSPEREVSRVVVVATDVGAVIEEGAILTNESQYCVADNSDIDWGNNNEDEYENQEAIMDDTDDPEPHKPKKKRAKRGSTTKEVIHLPVVSCKQSYISHCNSKQWLLAMGIGVAGVNVDTNSSPYATSKIRKSFLPTSKEMQGEIIRRANSIGGSMPRPKGWNFRKCSE
jgi:hypothetical protein